MKKTIISFFILSAIGTTLFAGQCEDNFNVHFTFFGAPNKSYVVEKNTFKKITSNFPKSKLKGASATIDLMSLDTSADMNNGKAKWPASMAVLRDNNTKNHLFKSFSSPMVKAKVKSVKGSKVVVAITMNGVTKDITMMSKKSGGQLVAEGDLDILDFNAKAGFTKFSNICRGFHKGKTWSTIKIYFTVPSSCA